MTTPDIDEALDWLGRPVDCKTCRYADRLAEGKCQPLKACVHDRYAKRIQRFFQWNEIWRSKISTIPISKSGPSQCATPRCSISRA